MVAVLLAGGPGAGKSTVASVLRDRGLCSVDLDYGFARHEDASGNAVAFPGEPDLTWLETHHWQWIDQRLTNLLTRYRSRNVLLCGTAYNMFDYLDRFALVILLRLDGSTMDARVRDPLRDNVFGKVGASAIWCHGWRELVETALAGAHAVDARQPLEQVVGEVLEYCAGAGFPVSVE
jgi:shikimate kinase